MLFYRVFRVADHQRGLLFRDGRFERLLPPGRHAVLDPLRRCRVDLADLRDVYLRHEALDVLARALKGHADARVLELTEHERAFVFVDGRFDRLLRGGRHVLWTGLRNVRVEAADVRAVVTASPDLARAARAMAPLEDATVLDVKDGERALVWVGGRFHAVLAPGLFVLWQGAGDVRVELLDARGVRFAHPELAAIVPAAGNALQVLHVEDGHVGLWFQNGELQGELKPGLHAFWAGIGRLKLVTVDLRERTMDIQGQELMTQDKVTLRLNAVVAWRVAAAARSVTVAEDAAQALYREAQLALRAVVGARELDALLAGKEAVAAELRELVARKAPEFGLEVRSLGIRDIMLPGDMKELMNKVTEARKAAEAALVTRREETAAARMQANTARILEASPVLMKLRELETLEKIAAKANLKVVLGEDGGLKDRVTRLL